MNDVNIQNGSYQNDHNAQGIETIIYKKHSKYKWTVLQSKSMFMTEEMLQTTKETKSTNVTKNVLNSHENEVVLSYQKKIH